MSQISVLLRKEIEKNVTVALDEDIGDGDLTALLSPAGRRSRGTVICRQDATVAGIAWFDACMHRMDPSAKIRWHVADGETVRSNQAICDIESDTRALLTAERSALNFLQLLSATATVTKRYVDAVAGTHAQIVDTRKTLPGLRLAQKYAVRCGGGTNHRLGLYDGILIKENHIMAAGGVTAAMTAARAINESGVFIQIEVENMTQLDEALANGAQLILLDNMNLEQMAQAVTINAGRAKLEASGGVQLETVRAIAETGVDRISIGSLTKDIRAIDLSLRHQEA
jgi:nicotinate-nucleotide pyrophosphorylase (carboxylating)